MPSDIPPGLDAPLDVAKALHTAAANRLCADPLLASYENEPLAEEFSAAHYAWIVQAPAAKLIEAGEAVAADHVNRSRPGWTGG